MQGQRGKMVSLPETFEIDRASSSSGAAINQPVCWNEMSGPSESHFPGFMLSTNETGIPFSIGQEQHNVNDWNLGEASSSNGYRSNNGEWKAEGGWTTNTGRHGPMIEDQQYGASSGALSLDNARMHPMFVPGSASSSIPLNINSVGDYGGPNIENPPLMEYSNLYKTSGSNINLRFPTPTGSQVDPSVPSRTSGFVREDGEVRLGGPLDGRRVPCKRKSFEGHVGQSSFIESPNFPQPMESSSWHATPPCLNMNAVPTSQQLPEHFGRGLGLNLAGGSVARGVPDTENPESLHRNFRFRVNSSGHNDMRSTPLSSSGMASNGNPGVILAPQSSSRVAVANRSLELPPPSAFSGAASHWPHSLVQAPLTVPGGHSVRWARVVPGNNTSASGTVLPVEATSSGSSRNVLQHSMFASSLSSSSRGHVNASSSSYGGNVDSIRGGSSASAAPQLPHHSLAPQANHQQPRYPRRLTELVRRQLLSTIGSNSEGAQFSQTSNSAGRGVPPNDVLLSSGQNATSHRHSLSRSGIWMGRQGDSVVGFPYPMRTLSASEGRRRLASEIRSVLERIRRGEGNIRFEDVMILDPAMLWGVADMHDRHRDMRLDVDNMSYEELLALEERIGNVSTGLNEETILAQMNQRKHSNVENTQMEAEPCCICQEDYNDGEDLGTLECGHDFHRDCIKQWLMQKNLCPICKTTGLST